MPPLIDISGKKFGRLTVVSRAGSRRNGNVLWLCKCDCGNETIQSGYDLRTGHVYSCGCARIDYLKTKKPHLKDGREKERLHRVWRGMHERCEYPKHVSYPNYGGRGIRVCSEWSDYVAFKQWAMSHGYDPAAPRGACTIDRINPDGDYSPENCRWVSNSFQQRNKRSKEVA